MRRILLVNFLVEEKLGSGKEKHLLRMSRGEPLGLMYLASVFKLERNIEADILDERIVPFSADGLAEIIDRGGYDALGIYLCTDPDLEKKAARIIETVRGRTSVPIIAGGPPFEAEPILKAGCDMVCNGEGERTALDMLDVIEGKRGRDSTPGISYIEGGSVIETPPRAPVEDLDSIPFPTRSRSAAGKYFALGNINMRRPYFSVVASRGCPMNCAYCSSTTMWGRQIRHRSPANVLEEISMLVSDCKARYIAFRDDIFGGNGDWNEEFCLGMIDRKYPVGWVCNMHPSLPRRDAEARMRLLRRAGCDTVHFGIQSADPEILKSINRKPEEPLLLKEKIVAAKKQGMLTFVEFIVGLPGETRDSVARSVDFAFESRPDFIAVYSLGILKGSPLYDLQKARSRPLTELTKAEIDGCVHSFRRKYMTNPRTVINLVRYVLKNNPKWLITALFSLYQIFTMLGVNSKRKTF